MIGKLLATCMLFFTLLADYDYDMTESKLVNIVGN